MLRSIRSFSTTPARNLAKISIIGTIGSDLEKRATSAGNPFIRYSVAVNKTVKGEKLTSWFNVACFTPSTIDFMTTYLGKGARVFVEADVTVSPYEREDGSKATSWMLLQNNLEVLNYPKKEEEEK